ncbi:ribonuclease inhibitor [Carassius gibelio]|uniref:ribonuclease inhibitor n=1 Tax=Carassius gibelio TaxID=101364 RepID=UPI002278EF7A|nr:ribonuclease inhibitor [Carassius gibelio]XP_052433067.1 ribonuclease inhibitor [Carassius gibelio]XP_052433069.1 ribonuclease inhibitor [Carassius gibelio]XP_052433070.1 ribonuclease inhibitor [Carassius gibelio]
MDLTSYLGFTGVNLSGAMASPHCKLETLRLNDCGITYEGCGALASARASNLSHLRELDLSGNKLEGLGMMLLSSGLENNLSELGTLKLIGCGITDEGYGPLASALASNSSHLRELDLSQNSLNDLDMMMLSAGLMNPSCKLEKIKLLSCGLTEEGCAKLASALGSNSSHLRELDLSENNLGYFDMMLLSAVMENPYWKLEVLKLVSCSITDEGCAALASALGSNPSHLRELDLSKNSLSHFDMILLSAVMESAYWKLETLKLKDCGITEEGFAALASALRSNPSHLIELDLSGNKAGDFGVQMLSTALEIPYSKLETLKLVSCDITENGCVALVSALRSSSSHFRNLDLSGNKLGHLGIKLLSDALENPCFKLETLKLKDCDLTDEDCFSLASPLIVNFSNLRELDLSDNKLGDSGVKFLFAGPESHLYKLATFKLVNCGITDEGCASLALALRSNPSHLRELDLSGNEVEDSGVQMLSSGLDNYYCQLETLRLVSCGITDEGCAALSSALTSNPTHLRQLDLSKNKLSDSGMNLLSTGLGNPHCKLEMLWLHDCGVTDEGCAALASALRSNPSHLRELDLSDNELGDLGVNLVSAGLEDCKLEILKLKHCGFTYEGCSALAALLGSAKSYLKYVDLSFNKLEDLGVQLLFDAFY